MQPTRPTRRQSRWAFALVAVAAALAGLGASPLAGAPVYGPAAVEAAAPVDAPAPAIELPGDPGFATLALSAELELLELTNADRAQNGLPPLAFDPDTLSVARERATS